MSCPHTGLVPRDPRTGNFILDSESGATRLKRFDAAYNAVARCLRKVSRSKRFDRAKAARPLDKRMRECWRDATAALCDYLTETEAWDKIQAHVRIDLAADEAIVQKALKDSDKKLIAELMAKFGVADIEQAAAAIVQATSVDTFEAAAQHALGQLGIKAADFELRNERILDNLSQRENAAIFASRNEIAGAMDTIVRNFYELGRNPYDARFIADLKKDLGYKADYQAKRFALTETGIAAELAQAETYRRNGVARKQWNILGANTRPTHAELSGVQVGIDEHFVVGGFEADHPLDPQLPAEELVNCHCWLSPVVDDEYTIDPSRIWEGQ
jgi:hypothetical protein